MSSILQPRMWWLAFVILLAGWMALMAAGRALWFIRKYGMAAYLRGMLRVEPRTWTLIAVLLLLAGLVTMVQLGKFPLLPGP